jgi:hypothetical protein
MGGHVDCARELLEAGCDASLLNVDGLDGWAIARTPHPNRDRQKNRLQIWAMKGRVTKVDKAKKKAAGAAKGRSEAAVAAAMPGAKSRKHKAKKASEEKSKSAVKGAGKAGTASKPRKKPGKPQKKKLAQAGANHVASPAARGDTGGDDSSDLEEWSDDD